MNKSAKNKAIVPTTCDLCQKNVDDPIELGEIMRKSQIQVHYYCLLISTHLPQKGNDAGGILGFLLNDIKKEIKECRKRVCCYCYKRSANAKCQQCDLYYHLICGLQNNCLFEFIDGFNSYCHNHQSVKHDKKQESISGCYICLRPMGTYNPLTSITAACCKSNCWVHRRCMKEYALSAGYYLQCLWCKSKQFREYVRRHGVFVPDRDALWERGGTFKDLYKRYAKCDATVCLCPKGREYKRKGSWNILVCNTCATSGMHAGCLPKQVGEDSFQCTDCRKILKNNNQLSQPSICERTRCHITNGDENLDTSLFISKSQRPFYRYDYAFKSNFSWSQKSFQEKPLSISGKANNNRRLSESSPQRKLRKITDKSDLKPCICLNVNDKSKIQYVLLDSRSKIVKREDIVETEFDDDLIHKLVKKINKRHSLHTETVEVSEDDSDKSVADLIEAMTTKLCVPKPKLIQSNGKNRKQHKSRSRCELLRDNSVISSSNDSYVYPVSPNLDKTNEPQNKEEENPANDHEDEMDKTLPLKRKIGFYFNNYIEGSPAAD